MKERLTKFHETSNQRGITLIALVITIVILIILATVSINVVLGEGGLIQRAQEGKDLTEQARIDEKEELTGAEEYINSVINERKDDNEEETPVQEGIQVDEVTEKGIFERQFKIAEDSPLLNVLVNVKPYDDIVLDFDVSFYASGIKIVPVALIK